LILTYNTESLALKNTNKSKIPATDMKFLSSSEERARKGRLRNEKV
jgi:hypothetical protein